MTNGHLSDDEGRTTMRTRIDQALNIALSEKNDTEVAILRLISVALKDRDGVARAQGRESGIGDSEIVDILNKMVAQRRESICRFEQNGQIQLAEKEAEEIAVIERFLPRQLDKEEVAEAVLSVLGETGATSIKDMGRAMSVLKLRYAGRMDFALANNLVKEALVKKAPCNRQ